MARSRSGFDECADLICSQKYGAALQMFQRAVSHFLDSKSPPRRNEIARQLFQIGTALDETLKKAYGDKWDAMVPRIKDDAQAAVCSFCSKTQNEVRKIIAGPSVHICDECVDLCDQLLIKENLKENDKTPPSPTEERLCGICMEERESDELVFLPHAAYMCVGCLEAVQGVRDRGGAS